MSRIELTRKWWNSARPKDFKGPELEKALAAVELAGAETLEAALAAIPDAIAKVSRLLDRKTQPDLLKDLSALDTLAKTESKKAAVEAKAAAAGGKPADGHTSRGSFVTAEVKENTVSTKIINQIFGYFPKKYKVISAYLTASDLYWKVNYHWDAMRVWLEYAKDNPEMSEDEQKQLDAFYRTLMANPPSQTGHFKVNKIGEPADASSESTIEQRCKTLQKLKAELTAYSRSQSFTNKKMAQKNVLAYALNPLAMPKQSNHIHGWALDIAGDIPGAATIAKSLGATLAFKEMTHCHCEFRNGVKLPA